MAGYRNALPQLGRDLFLTDGGMETALIFHQGLDLPDFAAFTLLKTPEGEVAIRNYYRTYAELSKRLGVGLILESTTWRASRDWGARLGYTAETLAEANRKAMEMLEGIRREYQTDQTPVVISGCLGPCGDGYVPGQTMSTQEAATYHLEQIETFAATSADMVCSMTMNYVEEAVGIAWACEPTPLA
jgi:homocysteine S-methyltransferase